ncbi:MAG: DUF6029 family protein [Bacteroidales bacterium]|nr:DUF6029 family protein [Bacteroidales bacterium]
MKFRGCIVFCLFLIYAYSQENKGELSGNFNLESQYYLEDTAIGAASVDDKLRTNAYMNINYRHNNFLFGFRYEAYLNTLVGIDKRYDGQGIPYKYVSYNKNLFSITVGSFYEQFGYGLTLRAYEEKLLGYDNAFEGVKINYKIINGINVKGLIAKQRNFFSIGDGIVRASDVEININELKEKWLQKPTNLTIGASFVSKYQQDKDPLYKLPENVACYGGRIQISSPKINVYSEYAYKINDPSADNNYIYKNGEAIVFYSSYTTNNWSIILNAKRTDNMSFRSDRNAKLLQQYINYIPSFVKSYTYFTLSEYPYSSVVLGEAGGGIEFLYSFPKETFLGGKYGTNISLQYNRYNDIKRNLPSDTNLVGIKGTYGYSSSLFSISDSTLFENIVLEINKKHNKNFKSNFIYQYTTYNFDALTGIVGHGYVYSHIFVYELIQKLNEVFSLKYNLEYLYTRQDAGNWLYVGSELSVSPKWFFAVNCAVNHNNPTISDKIKIYYLFSITHVKDATRICLNYGKQPSGILCIGGICRYLPAIYGFGISLSTTF